MPPTTQKWGGASGCLRRPVCPSAKRGEMLSACLIGCMCMPGTRRGMRLTQEGERRMGARGTHHDVRNQAEMGWRPDEPQPPLWSWAFKRTLGHQGSGAVAFDQGSRVQHCPPSASPGRPPLLRPVIWGGGERGEVWLSGHTPCSRANSNCVSGIPHMHRVRRLTCPACAQVWEGAGQPEQSQPCPSSTGAAPTAPQVSWHGGVSSQGVYLHQVGGPGPGSPLVKGGPGLLVGAPQLVPDQLLSCFPAGSPLVSTITGDNPVPDVQAPEQTVHLGSGHPTAHPRAHGDGRPSPPATFSTRPSPPAPHKQRPAAMTPLGTLGKSFPPTSLGPDPWISPGVILTVPPCEALWSLPCTRHPLQTLPPVCQHHRMQI